MSKKEVLESVIETRLKERIKALGGLTYKFKSTVNGVPDQIVLYAGGTYFVEVKRPHETPRADQVNQHKKMKNCGIDVTTVATFDDIDQFIRDVLKTEPVIETKSAPGPVKIRSLSAFDI